MNQRAAPALTTSRSTPGTMSDINDPSRQATLSSQVLWNRPQHQPRQNVQYVLLIRPDGGSRCCQRSSGHTLPEAIAKPRPALMITRLSRDGVRGQDCGIAALPLYCTMHCADSFPTARVALQKTQNRSRKKYRVGMA